MDPTNWEPPVCPMPERPRRVYYPWDTQLLPHSTEAYPVPDLLAGLTFLPSFPDRVPRAGTRNPDPGWFATGAYVPFSIHPTSWAPSFPDTVPPPHRPWMQSFADPAFGFHTEVAAQMSWSARFPDLRPRTPPPIPGGSVGPLVPIHEEPCVEWTIEVATITDLIDEALTLTDLTAEDVTTTALIAEEFC